MVEFGRLCEALVFNVDILQNISNGEALKSLCRRFPGVTIIQKGHSDLICQDDNSMYRMLQLVYCCEEEGSTKQITVDSMLGASIDASKDPIQVSFDIDSIIGQTKDLPLRVPLSLYPISPWKETLRENVHLNYMLDQKVRETTSIPSVNSSVHVPTSPGIPEDFPPHDIQHGTGNRSAPT